MTKSIRTYLLANLLISVTVVTSLAVAGNLYLNHRNFQAHLDSELTMSAYTIDALLSRSNSPHVYHVIQEQINQVPSSVYELHQHLVDDDIDPSLLMQSVQFKIWDEQGQVILQSYAAPEKKFERMKDGFYDTKINKESWRVLALKLPQSGYHILMLQRHDFRAHIEKEITEDSLTIMLMTYPFLGLLIWLIVGQGLRSIQYTAKALRKRQSHHLKPIAYQEIPVEILPLVNELNQLFLRLKESFQREQRFAGDAAHELKTPLAALKAQAEVALRAKDPVRGKDALRKVMKGVDRATHVVQQLLTLSRMTPEALINAPESLSLKSLASEMIAELILNADNKNITLSLEAPKRLRKISANKGAILILLRNLIDNAIRYSPRDSSVEINIFEKKGQQILEIIDHGPGIAAALRERVFERFYRVIGNDMPGSGLGLGIVKQIVQLHRGTIGLEDPNDHQGLKVVVAFPIEATTMN